MVSHQMLYQRPTQPLRRRTPGAAHQCAQRRAMPVADHRSDLVVAEAGGPPQVPCALDAQTLDEVVRAQAGARAAVALERPASRADRRGRVGDGELVVEMLAHPLLEL